MFVLDTVAVLATSRAGNIGFLLVTDVETKYIYIYCYKNKSEVAEEVINYVKKFQRLSGINLKQLHSDQGTEFVNQRIIEFCTQERIKFTTSAAYVPQHNGIAERSNQYILSKMRQLINMLEIEKSFYWDFAAYYSAYITNRVTEGGTDISSFERIYNKKPKLYRFYIFGSLIVYVQKTENKIQSKGTYGYFMGYNPATGEALIVVKISRYLIKTRDFISIGSSENLFGNEEENIQSEIKNPLNIGESDQNKNTRQVETNVIDTDTIQNENNEDTFVRRSTRVTKVPDKLTYDQENISNLFLFEEAGFVFQFPELFNYATALVSKDFTIPKSFHQIKHKPESDKWYEAYDKELKKIELMGKMELIKNETVRNKQAVIPIMELFSKKYDNISKQNIFKCRFVARGDLQEDYLKFYSPASRLELIRFFNFIVAKENYLCTQLDIGNAFLNAKLDTEYLYSLPQKLKIQNPTKVWKSSQAIYGLKEAPLYWHKEISEKLEKAGFIINRKERTILKHKEKCIIGLIYVDDILFAGREEKELKWIIYILGEHYKVKQTSNVNNYVGFEITSDEKYLYLTAKNYINNLCEAFEIQTEENIPHIVKDWVDKDIDSEVLKHKKKYQSIIGALTYINRVCRPDITFQVNVLAQCASKPSKFNFNCAKKVAKYLLKTKNLGLRYTKGEHVLNIEMFCDASYGMLKGGNSMTGYVLKVNKQVVLYKSKKQKTIATSSAESEILACSLAVKEMKWLKINLKFFGLKFDSGTIKNDNLGAVKKLGVQASYNGIKQLEIEHYFMKQVIEEEGWIVEHVSANKNDADILTKPVSKKWFIENRDNWMCKEKGKDE
eukprot:snap_masked-scaffold_4-processed-gene-19.31-mRNA-1 protein AED:1.00 eAED:1.00 QI:0/-1/0/0/-1/1/1/0/838